MTESGNGARVLQVSVSAGGVPKLPVAGAWVATLGVEGDAHRERTVHGGPHRAVCLYGIEAIERLQAEGHPVEPGSVGENLTTVGIEWSTLPVGTRARVGERLLLEVASSTTPCATQRPNFRDGRFGRINIALHPSDSRMYARVLEEGYVRPGDPIALLPPAPGSRAGVDALLDRLERPEKASSLKLWAAARGAGFDVRVLDDGDVCAGASAELAEPAFNHAHGLRQMPQLLPEILDHFRAAGTAGLIPHVAPEDAAAPVVTLGVHAAVHSEVAPAHPPPGVDVRPVGGPADRAAWIETYVAQMDGQTKQAWQALLPHLLAQRDVHAFLARVDRQPAGVGLLFVRRAAAVLRGGFVLSAMRRRGVQRALIAARAQAAFAQLGCDVIGSLAEVGSISARNLERAGLGRIDIHHVYRFTPPASHLPTEEKSDGVRALRRSLPDPARERRQGG